MKITSKLDTIKKIDKTLEELKSKRLLVGVLGEGVNSPQEGGVTILQYAVFNEYGTSTIPARPFFRTATKTRKSIREIQEFIVKQVEQVVRGNKNSDMALNSIGLYVTGRIQKSIKSGNWEANAESTKKRKIKKGGTLKSPLIDSGSLIKSIYYEIKNK